MKVLKIIGQLLSIATIGVGIATYFIPPLWPIAASFAGLALSSWSAYGLVKYFRSSVKPPVQSPIQPSYREIALKELEKHIDELKEKSKNQDVQMAALRSENESLERSLTIMKESYATQENKNRSLEGSLTILKENYATLENENKSLEAKFAALQNQAKPARRHSFSSISLPKLFKPVRCFSFDDAYSTTAKVDNSGSINNLSVASVSSRTPRGDFRK